MTEEGDTLRVVLPRKSTPYLPSQSDLHPPTHHRVLRTFPGVLPETCVVSTGVDIHFYKDTFRFWFRSGKGGRLSGTVETTPSDGVGRHY